MDKKLRKELNYRFFKAVCDRDAEQAEKLIKMDADVNFRDADGWTPLYWAIWYESTECMKLLAEAGADVNVCDSEGDTPLHLAAYMGRMGSMLFLVEAGADIDMKNNKGASPADMLKEVHPGLHAEYINELMFVRPEVRRLGSEDRKEHTGTAFEFDI